MIESYNAFISYRHVARDIKIAEEIQNQLEHYKIPKEITEKTGIRKIERIFRDKSELPITSNLTDDIKEALRNSEFLIVICSPEALESLWIRREIALFLETHPHEHILTVLSAGEPETAIPDLLLSRTVVKTDEEGNRINVVEPVEPLSCDYRLPLSKARKTELPRLAATLIGCSYDELVQRANQYRLRRWRMTAAAVGAASAIAVSYLVWSNMQISSNLAQSQKNMSLYLAGESLDAMADQDRIGAIQLALEALPDEGNERPVVAEAEYALSSAIGAYDLPDPMEYKAVRRFEAQYPIKDFLVNPAGDRMAALDREDNLYIWDLEQDQLVYTQKMAATSYLYDGKERGFYLSSYNDTQLLNWQDGSRIWENEDPCAEQSLHVTEGSEYITKYSQQVISVIDQSGKTVRSMPVPETESSFVLSGAAADRDGKKLLLTMGDIDRSIVMLADPKSGELRSLEENPSVTDFAGFLENGNILTASLGNDLYHVSDNSFYSTYSIYDMTSKVCLYDGRTLELIWKTEIPFTQDGPRSFERMDYRDADEKTHAGLLCSLGTVQVVIDTEDGSIFRRTEWPSPIRNVISKGGDSVFSLLENGDLTISQLNEEYVSGVKAFVNDSKKALVSRKEEHKFPEIMVLPRLKPYILQYRTDIMPPEYQKFGEIKVSMLDDVILRDNHLVMDFMDMSMDRHIAVFDKDTQQSLLDYPVESYDSVTPVLSDDGETLYLLSDEKRVVTAKEISIEDGSEKVTEIQKPQKTVSYCSYTVSGSSIRYAYLTTDADVTYEESTSTYTIDTEGRSYEMVAGSYDFVQGRPEWEETIPLEGWSNDTTIESIVLSEDGKHCVLYANDNEKASDSHGLYLLNMAGKEQFLLLSSDKKKRPGSFNQSGTAFALPEEEQIRVFDMSGKESAAIPYKRDSYLASAYLEDELYILTNESCVYRYSAGNELRKEYQVYLYENSNYSSSSKCRWKKEDGRIFMQYINLLNVISLDQKSSSALIKKAVNCDPGQDIVFIEDDSESIDYSCPGIMHVYETADLVRLGKSVLQNYMTEE